uniref:hypothetical protein n=1 Tax=Eubacterium maltosivorans TaxID=2041044 RepID=UPI00189F5E38
YNPNKLSGEMYAAKIECWISIGEQEYILEYQNTTMEAVQAVLDAHDPTPEPEPLTDLQQTQLAVAEAVEKQEADKKELQLALAEFIESTMGGGE